jgi:hypothetical protein
MTGILESLPAEIVALIEKPVLLFAVLAVGAFIGMTGERLAQEWRRWRWRQRKGGRRFNGRQPPAPYTPPSSPTPFPAAPGGRAPHDAVDQLRIVMRSQFTSRPLLNRGEHRVFKDLDRMVLQRKPGWQVMGQVALGEILSNDDKEAFSCINSKRVDLLVVDEHSQPRHVFEYQGQGHFQNDAPARDAVKREALRQAGISYTEIFHHTKPADLQRLVEMLLNRPEPPPKPMAPLILLKQKR